MKVDASQSIYHEDPDALAEFDRKEIRRCRYILRRLRFLEAQVRETGSETGGAMHAEWEIEALEWLLGPDGVGFLSEDRSVREPINR